MKGKSQKNSHQKKNNDDQCGSHNRIKEKEKIIEIDELDDLCFDSSEVRRLSFEYIKESYSE